MVFFVDDIAVIYDRRYDRIDSITLIRRERAFEGRRNFIIRKESFRRSYQIF